MFTRTCGVVAPNERDRISGECLLKFNHASDEHLCEGKHGIFYSWQTDYQCGCEYLEDCDCFVYWEVTQAEALRLLLNST